MHQEAITFEFTSYVFKPKEKRIFFNYKTEFNNGTAILFTETIVLPGIPNTKHIPSSLVEKLLQGLHLMLGISYYKGYCAPNLKIPYALSKQEADFFATVYKKGLGEFFYKNNLDPSLSPTFPYSNSPKLPITNYQLPAGEKFLVGIGGGKDSIVSAELLKEHGANTTAFHIETGKPSELVNAVIKKMGIADLKIQRFLDKKAYEAHRYNGHIPISAIYAFLGVFTATLYGYSHVVVSNEHSSNFGNTVYKGLDINHQWSKSFEFETLFQEYVTQSLTPDITYFSLLRTFYEIRIVKLFSTYKKYFPLFSSCNKNFTSARQSHGDDGALWCGQCAKCLFAFTLLSAFLPKKELISIFGKNLYQQEELLPLFKDIVGLGSMKPFDCVGTFQEAQTAVFLARKSFATDFIMRQIGMKVAYHKEVFETNSQHRVPESLRLLGMESAYILGYGKEGKVTKQYLKKQYPKLKIGVGDVAKDPEYLKRQVNFDIAIKTPGIKKELVTIPYTTATNLFFSKTLGKYLIIGVTGSKGKSTTASLVYHILKTAKKNVKLLGNIGQPMLGSLLTPLAKNTIFVLELSSYQLDDIAYSPDIAVVTNLFPEHLDYHGSLQNYYGAKKNIINFQHHDHFFVYDPGHKKMLSWLQGYPGKVVPFVKETFESNLIGQHNQNNIGAAAAVANLLGIPKQTVRKAIKSFKGLAHRLELVGTFRGITFYDDAISTTPESTIMAIKSLKNIGTVFLGGTDRGYDFSQLEKTIRRYAIKNIVLFPESGNRILTSGNGLNVLKTTSMEKAVAFAYQHAKEGEICLLSCASPSYSLWKNFEEKGDEFKKFVKKLSKR